MKKSDRNSHLAPSSLTAGFGTFYDVDVVATCLIELLAEQTFQNEVGSRLVRVSVQKQDDRWRLDDILLSYDSVGNTDFLIPISVKSFPLFSKTTERQEFVQHAWTDFLAMERRPRKFDPERDRLGLFARFDGSPRLRQIETLIEKARQQDGNFVDRILEPTNFQDAEQWLQWLRMPSMSAAIDTVSDDLLQTFIASLHVRNFDFGGATSLSLHTALESCRSMCAGEQTEAGVQLWHEIWEVAKSLRLAGGDMDRRELINRLKTVVQLKASPRFNVALQVFRSKSAGDLAVQPRKIGGKVAIGRPELERSISDYFNASEPIHAIVLGDSGVGKSTAVANAIESYGVTNEIFFFRLETACEIVENEALLFKPFTIREVFAGTAEQSKIIVIDGVEQASNRNQVSSLAKLVLAATYVPTIRLVLVCQREQYQRVLSFLNDHNVDAKEWKRILVDSFSTSEALKAIMSRPSLRRLFTSPELPSLYRRPIILDALLRIDCDQDISHLSAIGESHLIHWVWEHRITAVYGTAVSNLLLALGQRQGDESELETSQSSLPEFANSIDDAMKGSLLERNRTKVRFSHDIYADWSRMLWLLNQGSSMHDVLEEKSQRPKWLRAIRMVGINLLEQDESKNTWLRFVGKSSTVSDLFLDAILFSANPDVLLDQLSQHLFDSKALLARRLVRRAMVVCSVPGLLADRKAAAGEVVTSVHRTMQRDPKPYHASFGSLLQFLERNVDAVVEHLPHDAAKMTRMWLEMTPVEWPYRASAAKVALALCQNLVLGDKRWSSTEDEASEEIFKAVFFAFEDSPQDATNLLLNAAGLEPNSPRAKRSQERANEREKKRSEILSEPIRDLSPWPSGPIYRPHASFRKACLAGDAMWPIFKDSPNLARRLILAVSIKMRSDDVDEGYHHGGFGDNENGLERLYHSMTGNHYRQGPYLSFLQINTEAAISLVCEIANFASVRQVESIDRIGGSSVLARVRSPVNRSAVWLGDEHSFNWNRGLLTSCDSLVPALTAVEKYIGDLLDAGENVDQLVAHLVRSCESAAIAGVLFDLGRRHPSLFQGPLKPILRSPLLILWAETISANPKQPGFCNVSLDYGEWFFNEHKAWLLADYRSKSVAKIAKSILDSSDLDWNDPSTHDLKRFLTETNRMDDVFDAIADIAEHRPIGHTMNFEQARVPETIDSGDLEGDSEQFELQEVVAAAKSIEQLFYQDTHLPELELPGTVAALLRPEEESDDPIIAAIGSNNRLGLLLFLLLRYEQRLIETCIDDEVISTILSLLDTPATELSKELIDAGAMPRFLHPLAEFSVFLLARDSENLDNRMRVFNFVVGHRGYLHQAICGATWRRWRGLGTWGPRIIRLLFDTAAAFWYSQSNYPSLPRDSAGFDASEWLKSRKEQFLQGSYPDSVPVLAELPLSPPKLLWANWRTSRRYDDDEQCYLQLPIEETILEAIVAGTPLCTRAETEEVRVARTATVQVLLDYELGVLRTYSPEGEIIDRSDDSYPSMYGQRALLDRINAELKSAVDPMHVAMFWRQIFDRGVRSPRWIEQLIHSWMGPIIAEPVDTRQFARSWAMMLSYVKDHDSWRNLESDDVGDSSRAKLLATLLCIDKSYGSLWNEAHAELIASMKNEIKPLLREVVEDAETAAPALRWISRKIGSCFLPEAITWCKEIGKSCGKPRANSYRVQSLVIFLDVVYQEHLEAILDDYKEDFFRLVAQVARSEDAMAIELQQRIAGL
jgi:hypothetical protein